MNKPSNYHVQIYGSLGDVSNDFRNSSLAKIILSMARGKKILDIGCGTGFLLNEFKKAGYDAFGIEPNRKLISIAKHNFKGLKIYCLGAENVHKIKGEFNTITMIDVLEHTQDDILILTKLKKCLARGGRLVIVVPAFPALYGIRDKNNGHFRRYSKKMLKHALSACGLRIIEWRFWNMAGFIPYFFYEKMIRMELNTSLRQTQTSFPLMLMNKFLSFWFEAIENNVDFGFGLSLICVAEKNSINTVK